MFQELATHITANIDYITRRWVDELRLSERTQVHKSLLTAEIVNGVKAMLANLAAAIAQRQAPDAETIPVDLVQQAPTANGKARLMTTLPLEGPLERAEQGASAHGK